MSRAPATRTLKRRAQPSRGGRKAVRKVGLLDRAVAAIPVSEETLRKATGWVMFAAAIAVLVVMASWLGVPGAIGTALAETVGRAGFKVDRIEVTGASRMDKMTVYAVALDQRSRAMPLIDLDAVRYRLLDYPWIADARVSRRLPDTLVIDIVEREPVAIWQSQGQLMLIDVSGKPLEPVSPDAMPPLPLVIGDGANEQEPAYQKLMEAAPPMRRLVKAASWVGDRRWDLLFVSGEKLSLPEGEAASARALARFAAMDSRDRLLGRGYVSFDLRDPTKLVLRMPGGSTNATAITGEGA